MSVFDVCCNLHIFCFPSFLLLQCWLWHLSICRVCFQEVKSHYYCILYKYALVIHFHLSNIESVVDLLIFLFVLYHECSIKAYLCTSMYLHTCFLHMISWAVFCLQCCCTGNKIDFYSPILFILFTFRNMLCRCHKLMRCSVALVVLLVKDTEGIFAYSWIVHCPGSLHTQPHYDFQQSSWFSRWVSWRLDYNRSWETYLEVGV